MLIVNADDWGSIEQTTDSILDCWNRGKVNSVSGMVFMTDSARAAELARANGIDVGLHLNLTQTLSGPGVTECFRTHFQVVSSYLKARSLNQVLYNPRIRTPLDYIFKAQWDEYCRLYQVEPTRIDGHHHMHLCMNMLLSGLIPRGVRVRRNFTFARGEKSALNRLYRRLVDRGLAGRFQCEDCFFAIVPIETKRLQHIVELSRRLKVELMVHPGSDKEYSFLLSDGWSSLESEALRGFIGRGSSGAG